MSRHFANVSIDEIHSMAICAEIGERLRSVLGESSPLPARLAVLLAKLDELDFCESPSIIPSMENEVLEGA
jgi:hypothetical protein